MSKFGAVVRFLFAPERFIARSVPHDSEGSLAGGYNKDLRAAHAAGTYRPEPVLESNARQRTKALRRSLFQSGLAVLGTIVAAFVVGWSIRQFGSFGGATGALQVAGAAILLWATIWELGWEAKSIGGNTLVERVHSWIFRGLYVVGTFLLFLSLGL